MRISHDEQVSSLNGAYLWRLVNCVVELKKNVRQNNDACYSALLNRLRIGQCNAAFADAKHVDHYPCTNEGLNDYTILYNRLLQNLLRSSIDTVKQFSDAPIIVGRKNLRDFLNIRIIAHKARQMNSPVHLYHSKDYMHKQLVTGKLARYLWALETSKTNDSLGRLPLFVGMKVMIQENLAIAHKIVNGSEGTIYKIKYEVDNHGRRHASVVYVHVDGAGQVCADLDPDIVPIFPEKTYFKCSLKIDGKLTTKTVSRSQLPLLPAYVYTDYKSQGRSLQMAIVDIASARSLQGVYVMLSRVKSLDGLAILRPFSEYKVYQRLSEEIRGEFRRLEGISKLTESLFNANMVWE